MAYYTQFRRKSAHGVAAKGGLTKQAAVVDADINLILKKYKLTGVPPPQSAPIYADRVMLPATLEDAMSVCDLAWTWFEGLPASVRAACDNDAVQALRLVSADLNKAIEIGLIPGETASALIEKREARAKGASNTADCPEGADSEPKAKRSDAPALEPSQTDGK